MSVEIERTVQLSGAQAGAPEALPPEDVGASGCVPVARANAVAFALLQRLYESFDESAPRERAELETWIARFVRQAQFSGSADHYHNFAVDLARRNEYALACDVLEAGLDRRRGGFARSADLLADYLQYGVNCGRLKRAKRCFLTLLQLPGRRWTWRAFAFSAYFLMHLEEQDELDAQVREAIRPLAAQEKSDGYTEAERAMLALTRACRAQLPGSEESYSLEAQVRLYLRDEAGAEAALRAGLAAVPAAPKCALRLTEQLYARGDYAGAGAAVERALADASALPSEGYLQYLAGLCRVAQARQAGQRLDAAQAEAVYGRFERALVEMEGGRRPEWENLRRCARSLRAETGAEIPEKFEHLRALLDD